MRTAAAIYQAFSECLPWALGVGQTQKGSLESGSCSLGVQAASGDMVVSAGGLLQTWDQLEALPPGRGRQLL